MINTTSNKKKTLVAGGVSELLIIALPMMASHACDTFMTFTDRLFLSRLGTAHMNAALVGGLSSFMMATFFYGLLGYSTALVAQYYGSGQKSKCTIVTTQAVVIALVAYPIILLLIPAVRGLFQASGITQEQLGLQSVYFSILASAAIVGLLRSAISGFFSGIGRTRIVMVASVVSMVVNIAANYILIFGKIGVPAMGIRGAAYGTIIGGVCGLLILIGAYLLGHTRREYGVAHSFRIDLDVLRRLLKFGYPAGLEFVLTLSAFNAMIMLFHSEGQVVATAATVTFNWDMVAFVPLVGIEIAVTSLVGRYMGARQPDIAHTSAMSGIKAGSIYSAVMLVCFLAFPVWLVNVFRPDVHAGVFLKALPLTLFMVKLVAVYVGFEAVVASLCGALRGAGDTFWAMVISVALHWLMVGVLFVLFKVMHASPQVAWVSMITWFVVFSFVFYLRYRSGKWREIRVIDPALAPVGAD